MTGARASQVKDENTRREAEEKEEKQSSDKGAVVQDDKVISEENLEGVEGENDLTIWRCTCGEEFKRFGPPVTKHQKLGRELGEVHDVKLYNMDTGEFLANNIHEAIRNGILKRVGSGSSKTGRGSDEAKGKPGEPGARVSAGSSKDGKPYHGHLAVVEKYVMYTGELPGELLLLYEMTLKKFNLNRDEYTVEVWMEDIITRYYAEHAVDFDFHQIAENFVKEHLDAGRYQTYKRT